MLSEVTIAPAASVGPSLPSVPAANINQSVCSLKCFFIYIEKLSASSWHLPPLPDFISFNVTVVSPPRAVKNFFSVFLLINHFANLIPVKDASPDSSTPIGLIKLYFFFIISIALSKHVLLFARM